MTSNSSHDPSSASALGNINGKLDFLTDLLTEVRKDQKEVAGKAVELATKMQFLESHERRLQDQERKDSYIKGWIAAAGLFGGLVAWLLNLLTHK